MRSRWFLLVAAVLGTGAVLVFVLPFTPEVPPDLRSTPGPGGVSIGPDASNRCSAPVSQLLDSPSASKPTVERTDGNITSITYHNLFDCKGVGRARAGISGALAIATVLAVLLALRGRGGRKDSEATVAEVATA